jgi:MYXO-CTERM domain-containing protein
MFRTALVTLLVGGFAALSPAAAQNIKPRILVVFDTSGSMGFDLANGSATGGDNSVDYPGDGGTSRLAVAKQVISEMVETTSEVEFGLMRYPQVEGPGINDGSDRAPYTGYEGLDRTPLNYMGFCNGTLRRDAADTSYALVEPFAEDNENNILRWLDGREAWPVDRELRAEGPTPIAESMRLAETYLRTEVLAADPQLRCRESYVVLLTDGAESCVPGNQQAVLLERTLALREMDVDQDGLPVRKSVRVFVVAFAVDPAQQGLLDTIARVGGTAINPRGQLDLIGGRAYQAADQAGLRTAFSQILAEAIPVETCNGIDDDCDGQIDEGALNACGVCGPTPVEVCNGVDDDCDGAVDEGVRNTCGGCGPLPAETCNEIDDDCDGQVDENVQNACGGCAAVRDEVCNGLDDDCDGQIDNQPGAADGLARPCSSDVGACAAGVEICADAVWGACSGVEPAEEACDGVDNDCDGVADELSRDCGPAVAIGDVGQCRVGRQSCADGAWSDGCVDAVGPSDELCDGLDNDCDGQADEGLFNACGRCGVLPPEICNLEDDNCDGRVDEDAQCPRGFTCWVGECVVECDASGECPGGGLTCLPAWGETQLCHPDACAGVQCRPGLRCDAELGGCVDDCREITCPEGEGCEAGACVPATCRNTGCAEGERCEAEGCVADLCAGVICGEAQFCREGQCVDACLDVRCEAGTACLDGACAPDDCGGRCARGQICDPADGACVADPCMGVTCAVGQACVAGACTDDAPCAFIECPRGTWCVAGSCTDGAPSEAAPVMGGAGGGGGAGGAGGSGGALDPDAGDVSVPDAEVGLDAAPVGAEPEVLMPTPDDEGCNCDVGADAPPSLWWFGLLLLGVRRRRR